MLAVAVFLEQCLLAEIEAAMSIQDIITPPKAVPREFMWLGKISSVICTKERDGETGLSIKSQEKLEDKNENPLNYKLPLSVNIELPTGIEFSSFTSVVFSPPPPGAGFTSLAFSMNWAIGRVQII